MLETERMQAIAPEAVAAALSERALREPGDEISAFMKRALEQPDLISLAVGFVDQASLPCAEVAELATRVLSDPVRGREALQYGLTPGFEPLREEIAGRLRREGVRNVGAGDVLITNGSQQMLQLTCEALLDPGDIVLVENPTYFVFLGALKGAGARPVGVATDRDGIIPEALEATLARLDAGDDPSRVKLLYAMTSFANPRGTCYSAERRAALHDVARRASESGRWLPVIEDSAYRPLRFEGEEPPYLKSWDADNSLVVLTGTFSKSFAPGLRTGWAVVPRSLMPHLLRQKSYHDFGSPSFAQAILHEALRSGAYDEHVARLRERYRAKRNLALEVVRAEWPPDVELDAPQGGMYFWARLPRGVSTDPGGPVFESALNEHQVLYIPGSLCYAPPEVERAPNHEIRICYGMIDDDRLIEGMRRLGRAIRGALA